MSAPIASIFPSTKRIQEGILLLNKIELKRLTPIATRIINALKEKNFSPFTSDEESQLKAVLHLSSTAELNLLLDLLFYLFEQSAYYSLSAEKLLSQLQLLSLSSSHCSILSSIWGEHRDSYLLIIREELMGTPLILDHYSWRLQLSIAEQKKNKKKAPNAIINWGLIDQKKKLLSDKQEKQNNNHNIPDGEEGEENNNNNNNNHQKKNQGEKLLIDDGKKDVTMECSMDQVEQLFNAFETIQKQLDALTDK